MKISYNWLKWYIPEAPSVDKITDTFTFHLCEVESVEKIGEGENTDWILDIKILPDRAHDLLSHRGIARELASLLDISFVDPISKYKIPESKNTNLKIEIGSEKCRRYMGRIVRNVKVGPSPDWVKNHLESIGQRSINNMVDAANIVMFDCGQPTHVFDLNKIKEKLIIRQAQEGEKITTLDNRDLVLKNSDLVIADEDQVLVIAGIKGGKTAEVEDTTVDIILEVANFDPTSVRKTAQFLNIFTDARKRFENDLSTELAPLAMQELSALILEMCPTASFEDIVDVYPQKQEIRKLSFSSEKVSKILGLDVSKEEIENILKRYNFEYKSNDKVFEIIVPYMRFDLNIEEDMAEEIGRVLGYDKVEITIPQIKFEPKVNEIFSKTNWARNKLLNEGCSEVMTYVFKDKGEVEVLASASDKKFLRTNLVDGLKESLKLNQNNAPLLEMNDIKIFEIGTVFKKDIEEIHVACGDKKEIKEMTLNEFCLNTSSDAFVQVLGSPVQNSQKEQAQPDHSEKHTNGTFQKFIPWSIYPFISRDVSVWMPEGEDSNKLKKILIENGTNLLIKEPYIFDSFTKDGKTSYAFRLVFQSYERTLKDEEVNVIMIKISHKISENSSWQIR